MKGTVHYEARGRVAVLTIDNPPVNALSSGVRQGLADGVARALEDEAIGALVLVGDGRTFIAGADITEFGKKDVPGPKLWSVLEAMEGSSKPIVAALHGTALGGGLETAMCCDYRVALASTKLGLPEVNLGLLPGAGGTQRLPRLVGPAKAAMMMLTGKPLGAAEALAAGLVDELVEGDLTDGGVAFAEKILTEARGPRKVRDTNAKLLAARGDESVLAPAAAFAEKRRRHQTAPQRILECVRFAVDNDDFDAGCRRERELFMECMADPQRAAMIHVFFSERQVARIPDIPKDTAVATIAKVGVVGAGTMGAGIATAFAQAGMQVVLADVSQDSLDRGLGVIDKNLSSAVRKGRVTTEKAEVIRARVTGALALSELRDVDLVIEAVFENLDLKKKIFAELDGLTKPATLLATNTSTLDIDAIAAATERPDKVLGMHFFSPAHVMRLLEVVRGEASSKETLATAMKLARPLGKVAVLAGNCDGFIGNRMLAGYGREAAFLLEEGATPAQVDGALVAFGMPMGPFAMGDLAGLDVGWRIRQERGLPEGVRYSPIADRLCEQGRFGQKTRAGWYRYEEGSHAPIDDVEVHSLIEATAKELGVERRAITDEEIIERCIYPLVNEGARILDEGIALRALDIDTVWVNGYGFPVWRGGPMHWASHVGLQKIHETIVKLHGVHGELWAPAPLLAKLAAAGGVFE